MTQEIIKLSEVTKYYKMGKSGENIVKALDGVDIGVMKGDFVTIMGPSGSGKSTAMNLVGSLDLATKGQIFLDGYDIEKLEESELAQIRGKRIGFIFQSFNLISTLTANENIMLPMIFQGVEKKQRQERAKELLELVDLQSRADHYPNELSGGQQQRVAIARALANDPEVILADEPTGNLDSKTGEKVIKFLEDLHNKGKTIILITHDPEVGRKYSHIIYYLRDGKVEKVEKRRK